jgi:uncharacterized phage-associated protein
MYSAKAIANYFLDLAAASGEPLDPIKLQKLVYYAIGWYAGNTGARLIDEEVKAWAHGPIIPSVYHAFIQFGTEPITGRATETDGLAFVVVPAPDSEDVQRFLTNVWESYRGFTTRRMSEMAHALNSPWDVTVKNSHGIQNVSIPFEAICGHFALAAKEALRTSPLNNDSK